MPNQDLQKKVDELTRRIDGQDSIISEQEDKFTRFDDFQERLNTHRHTGFDMTNQLVDEPSQYSSLIDYTATTTTVHNLTFKPKMIITNAYLIESVTNPNIIAIASGSAGIVEPRTGMSSIMGLTQDNATKILTYALGTYDKTDAYLIKVPNVNTYVEIIDWGDNSVTIKATIVTNWKISLNLMIIG